jgi:hypothetical protein
MYTLTDSQTAFHREFLMARHSFTPQQFGVDLDRAQFDGKCVEEFTSTYRSWTFDELLLHPQEAMRFCSDTRRKYGWWDVPDDIILRVIMANRKNPV